MTDIDQLVSRVANHLAQKPVEIRWQRPPSESAAGQLVKTPDGRLIVYVSPNLTGWESRFKVLLHEIAHARLDADFVPVSDDHTRPAQSVTRSPAARAAWRSHPRESRADVLAVRWMDYAAKNAYKHDFGYYTAAQCKLLALLDWQED